MNRPLKVLQLGSASGLYGAERWILSLIKYFNIDNVESLVGAVVDDTTTDAPLCQEAQKLGFEALTIQSGGRYSFDAVLNLRKIIKEQQIDIVHSHGYKTDVLSLLATVGLKCKSVSTPHGWTQDPDFKLKLYEMMDRMIFPFFDAVVPLSDGLMDSLTHIPNLRKKLSLITNGVDIGEIEDISVVAPEITALKEEGVKVIGYIGRLVHGKGLLTLIEGLAKLSDIKWKAIIIGEGEQELELRQLVNRLGLEEQVDFLGFRADRLALLKGFDVFVLPSLSEGIPRCIMESMAAEVPVVASNIPGCRTLIDGEKTGALFDVNDADGLSESVRNVLQDPALNEKYRTEAKQFLLEKYSAKRMAKEYEELFKRL